MAVYRYQVVCVGMWRGKIKRWNTTFHINSSSLTASVKNVMMRSGYPNPGDVAGACSGGVASIAVYNATGGAPISNTIYFDWETPSEWIPYSGEAWAGVTAGTPIDASGESAVTVEGNMAGLSATGKPVKTRKYLHAIPSRTAAAFADPDIEAGPLAALQALFTPAIMCNPAGVQPATVSVDEWYGNHQRVRGRRRTVTQVAAQSFSAGVVTGVGASGGGASPAQFQ